MEGFGVFLILIFILLAAIPMVGMFFFIRWIIRKSSPNKGPEHAQNEQQQMLARVDYMKKSLVPWGNRSFTDISSYMTYKFSKGFARRLVGTVYSTNKEPIMAFSRVERGFKSDGYFFVGSTNFNLSYQVVDDNINVILNNESLGRITSSGEITDHHGNFLGTAKHPTKVSIHTGSMRYRFGDSTYEVVLNNKRLATIYVAPNYADFEHGNFSQNFNENAIGQPIIALLETPSPEEEKWLLAIAVLEIVHHGHWMI
ncbi:MAG: hypothetical protein ACSHWW_08415 [Nonlabens sp.]|uniref:hypothetical protein n=1 Tax=Nonlabens sp. TaxID=1888209 RepID=UPI003EF7C079